MVQERKKLIENGKLKCFKCKEFKTFPNFPFNGTGKCKKGAKGSYRSDTCFNCGGKQIKRKNNK